METVANESSNHKIEAYPIQFKKGQLMSRESQASSDERKKMLLKCKSCNKPFDSTFTTEEFASLPKDQNESGTLHLCPHCGHLAMYLLKDYTENE